VSSRVSVVPVRNSTASDSISGLKQPLIRGPVGSTVTLGLQRTVPFTEKKQEVYVDLVRGSSLFFLTQENKRASSKLGAMNTQLGEVELELNGLKNVLFQAENQVSKNKTDLASMQQRYDSVRMEIEKCQQEIASEEHKLLLARLSVPTEVRLLFATLWRLLSAGCKRPAPHLVCCIKMSPHLPTHWSQRLPSAFVLANANKQVHIYTRTRQDSASRERMRTLHDSLSNAEVRLSEVMEELKAEQVHAWQLENDIAKEHSLTSHLNAKIGLETKELENFPDYANRGMSNSEAEKRKYNRELEIELDELKMRDSFVAPDHLVPQKMAEEAGIEAV